MKYLLLILVTIGSLAVAVNAVQAAQTSAEASAAQAGATMEVGGALVQAQCLGSLAGLLGLAAGIGLGFWWRKRQEKAEQEKMALLVAQMRAAQQPRRANGQWRQGRQPQQPMLPQGNYPALPQPPYVFGQPVYYYPQQAPFQGSQQPQQPMIIEVSDSEDDADYLGQWGF